MECGPTEGATVRNVQARNRGGKVEAARGPTRRALVTVGILKPYRTGGNWAVFTEHDGEIVKKWKAERAAEKRERLAAQRERSA